MDPRDLPSKPQLGMWDGVSIVIGIVVGVGIFKTPGMVFANVENAWIGMGTWVCGGALALCGALCYAELGTTYPRSGGDYVYLSRAFGSCAGFLFAWGHLAVIFTGSIGTMAYAFSDYALAVWKPPKGQTEFWSVTLACLPIVVLTVLNLFGLVLGRTTQNVLTGFKVVGLIGLALAGFACGSPFSTESAAAASSTGSSVSFGLAMVFVLYTYGGWNDAAYVVSEVKDPQRNIPRVLILGTTGVVVIYVVINAAYLWGLDFDGVRSSFAPAADLMLRASEQCKIGQWGATAISVLVMGSALGAVNGMVLTGSRVYSSMGADHAIFAWLGRWNRRFGVPVWSLVIQGLIALALILLVGTSFGRDSLDQIAVVTTGSTVPWEEYFGGFNTLVSGTAPVFWLFLLLTGLSIFVLRAKDTNIDRPFSVPFYPFTPIVFCLTCAYMLYSSIAYARALCLIGVIPLVTGLALYVVGRVLFPTRNKEV